MADTPTTERDQCERAACSTPGRVYYRYGRALSTGPFTYSSGAQITPDQPIRLCSDHAVEAFGVSFTRLPGDPSTPPGATGGAQ